MKKSKVSKQQRERAQQLMKDVAEGKAPPMKLLNVMYNDAPDAIKTFLEDFQGLEPRIQKAHLQTILKAAHVYRDGTIDIEFRV